MQDMETGIYRGKLPRCLSFEQVKQEFSSNVKDVVQHRNQERRLNWGMHRSRTVFNFFLTLITRQVEIWVP